MPVLALETERHHVQSGLHGLVLTPTHAMEGDTLEQNATM
jgi:hypothetical protein